MKNKDITTARSQCTSYIHGLNIQDNTIPPNRNAHPIMTVDECLSYKDSGSTVFKNIKNGECIKGPPGIKHEVFIIKFFAGLGYLIHLEK